MLRRLVLCALGAAILIVAGCIPVHRYPAYRGRVLELGTDAPIERAGVLVSYWGEQASPGGAVPFFLDYQWALTNKEGKFEMPAKTFYIGRPLAWFGRRTGMTIYKYSYGNFPSSFEEGQSRQGRTKPQLDRFLMPGGKEVTFWLPKLETAAEIRDHDRALPGILGEGWKLPVGMSRAQFEELFGQ